MSTHNMFSWRNKKVINIFRIKKNTLSIAMYFPRVLIIHRSRQDDNFFYHFGTLAEVSRIKQEKIINDIMDRFFH